ncbi:MAG: hypothetical protein ACI3YK_00485 [Eubacteriales bacterium]
MNMAPETTEYQAHDAELGNQETPMRNAPKKTKKKRFKEGRRLRSLPPMTVIIPFVMKKRNDALNYFEDTLVIDRAEEYIAKKRAEGYTGFGLMHLFLAAYVRTLAEKPGVNRFIRGQRIYSRNNIEICLTIKKEMRADSPDTVVKFFPKPDATPLDIYNEVNNTVANSKADNDTSLDHLMNVLVCLPAFFFRFFVGLMSFLDYYRLLPRAFTKLSPFHGSYFITSMGSLGIPPIYHHIYNFGNIPLFTSFGAKYKEYFIKADGSVGVRKKVDYKIVMDERICDGFYYASALKIMQYYLTHPEKMDTPPETVLADVP